ncbi:MAG: DUF3393 domain-containing protein [Candidatus Delongbacteria bacterium]|nr:DUF3393 domain-containing protein [Candidatus Delongbacteria bacterium]
MKSIIILIVFAVFVLSISADEDPPGFAEFKAEHEQAFARYTFQQDSLFIAYQDELEILWNEFVESTPYEWVSYDDVFHTRGRVNFQGGEIKVEALVESGSGNQENQAKNMIKEQLVDLLNQTDQTEQNILQDQIINPLDKNETIDDNNVETVSNKILDNAEKTIIQGRDGIERVKYTITLDMVPNHIQIRAEKYKKTIEERCQRFEIEPSLVMAIIHTESYFNPKAYNRHGNAYGMMQIVPKYAGKLMNSELYHKNSEPGSYELFNPETNIEMGVGYLRWLADNKWQDVKSNVNRMYCMICSYNGGPGSVYQAMTGKMKKIETEKWNKMFSDLNTMNNEQLYQHLCQKIPFEETRNYLRKVKERINEIYSEI